MEGLKPNKVGFKSVPTSCPQHGVVDTCCLCPGGYGCETHTEIGGYGYCTNEKYIKLNLEATSGTMIKTNARDVCNHCMNKRRKKEARDNCASTLELNKDKDKEKEEESIKNCAKNSLFMFHTMNRRYLIKFIISFFVNSFRPFDIFSIIPT